MPAPPTACAARCLRRTPPVGMPAVGSVAVTRPRLTPTRVTPSDLPSAGARSLPQQRPRHPDPRWGGQAPGGRSSDRCPPSPSPAPPTRRGAGWMGRADRGANGSHTPAAREGRPRPAPDDHLGAVPGWGRVYLRRRRWPAAPGDRSRGPASGRAPPLQRSLPTRESGNTVRRPLGLSGGDAAVVSRRRGAGPEPGTGGAGAAVLAAGGRRLTVFTERTESAGGSGLACAPSCRGSDPAERPPPGDPFSPRPTWVGAGLPPAGLGVAVAPAGSRSSLSGVALGGDLSLLVFVSRCGAGRAGCLSLFTSKRPPGHPVSVPADPTAPRPLLGGGDAPHPHSPAGTRAG